MLIKSTLREIKSSLGRYLAIFAIMALGVAVFSGLKMSKAAMVDTANDFIQEHNLYDYEIMTSYGLDDDSVKTALKAQGVAQAEASIQKDIVVRYTSESEKTDSVLKAISLPKEINTLSIVSGRLPEKANECLVDNFCTVGIEYNIGDEIILSKSNTEDDLEAFKYKKYKVVGKVNTPLYLDYVRGSTSLGNGSLDTFFYIQEDGFDLDYYTHLYIKLAGKEYAFSDEMKDLLNSYEEEMDNLADKLNQDRKDTAREEAQKKLDERKGEYQKQLSTYNNEKATSQREIENARQEISSGKKTLGENETELKSTLVALKNSRDSLQTAIDSANDKKTQIEQVYFAGEISEEEYFGNITEVNAQIQEAQAQLDSVIVNISDTEKALETLENHKENISQKEKQVSKAEGSVNEQFTNAKKQLDDAKASLDDAQAEIDNMETGNAYAFSREDNNGYSTFEKNANIVNNVAKIFPVFFLLVAALVCITTMTRMIDEQRSQIGVLRALGFRNSSIRGKYLFYSGSSSLIGAVVGFYIGCRYFPMVVWKTYTMMYDFNHSINFLIDYKLGMIVVLAALLCSMGATWISCSNEFKIVPSALIKPKAPPGGRRILLERIGFIWNKINFMYKVSFRNVFRYKKRFLMMVLGICGCTALLIAAMGMGTTIQGVAERQFSEIVKYDYQILFDRNMSKARQDAFKDEHSQELFEQGKTIFLHSSSAKLDLGNATKELQLIATDSDEISSYIRLSYDGKKTSYPKDGEVAVCRKMQDHYGVEVGDLVTIRDGYREMTAKVSSIFDSYIQESIIMTEATYTKGMGVKPSINTAYVIASKDLSDEEIRQNATNISQSDMVSTTAVNLDVIELTNRMMKSLNAIVYVMILCAGLLSFIVLYNLTNINILERIREIATIKVLGFTHRETAQYVFRENVILTIIATIVGIPVGKLLLDFIINSIQIDSLFFLPRITLSNYAVAVVLTFVFTIIVNNVMRFKLNKVSMTDALKTTE